jgi:hypothetical protein
VCCRQSGQGSSTVIGLERHDALRTGCASIGRNPYAPQAEWFVRDMKIIDRPGFDLVAG